ncbi:ER membrane complex subunit EMC3 ASCRUDRAFT_35900 [Ascoidea rubescens DSM 1968]|uniref:ER membrane protein complex subunit 3 n=1 Tax=Ascoidea rubescens DSM 1968 TaxID=1344418 RepID=A0A1D2VG27_9ASCO|nr:transmembrane protein [Ascoidea rubescens DSM 1968]ODV60470.1 transmembrane protein [Ascoidea rubescens DSM 1968]
MTPELVLDPQLKYWVILPISFVMVMFGILRRYIQVLIMADSGGNELVKLKQKTLIGKCRAFRKNCFNLNSESFKRRQEILFKLLDEYIKEEDNREKMKGSESQMSNPLFEPGGLDSMMNIMKGNLANYIPQTVIMGWVNYFFEGFIVMKLPFPLTNRFKTMLQNGIRTRDLDVKWVSSISWYYVNLLGLRSVYNLLLNDSNIGDEMLMAGNISFGGNNKTGNNNNGQQLQLQPGGPSMKKLMENEIENIKIIQYQFDLNDIEKRVLEYYDC